MEAIIYANYGVLAHEHKTVYTTAPEITATVSEKLGIIIPDAMQPYITQSDEIALSLPEGFNPYLLRDVLATARNGMPLILWIDKNGAPHRYYPATFAI